MLHEAQFPQTWFQRLQQACQCNLVFAEVHLTHNTPIHIPILTLQVQIGQHRNACRDDGIGDANSFGCNASDVEGFSSGYKSMCQFLSLPLLKIPEVSKFDVIMRLDSDSFIHGAAGAISF